MKFYFIIVNLLSIHVASCSVEYWYARIVFICLDEQDSNQITKYDYTETLHNNDATYVNKKTMP